jgi:hypothetical protein
MKKYVCMAAFAMMLLACNKNSSKQTGNIQLEQIEADTSIVSANNDRQYENKKTAFADTIINAAGGINNASSTKDNNPDWNKKIIKTAELQLQLDDYKKFNTSVHNSLKQFGAYVAEEKQQQSDHKIENTLTIKVPVDQFDDLLNSLTGNGIKVMEKSISSEDVIGEVVDTKARMQAKMAVRDKYMQLLKQAKNMNEILQVQDEINDIQEDIEAANGRINYLQHASAYSTINLNYYQYLNGSTADNERPDFLTKLSRAFSTGTEVVSGFTLFCISIWPVILLGLFIWIYLKRLKLRKPVKA